MLDEMERHLMSNDADVVSAPQGDRVLSYRNIVYGAILVLAGLGGLIVGLSTQLIVVGVIGFVVMLGGVVLAVTPTKVARPASEPREKAGATPRSTSFMDRMNDRWDRRQDGS